MAFGSSYANHGRLAVIATITATLATLAPLQMATAAEPDAPFATFPLLIDCKSRNTIHIFYLSRVTEDGTATYVASDRIAGTISVDGHAKAIGGEGGGTCVGKTLDELRASGRAHDLTGR